MKWLLDEMLPPLAAAELRRRGHDAVSVLELDMESAADEEVYVRAISEKRMLVTENFADFALLLRARERSGQPVVPIAFVRKPDLTGRGNLATRLANRLDSWSAESSDPPPGLYWP